MKRGLPRFLKNNVFVAAALPGSGLLGYGFLFHLLPLFFSIPEGIQNPPKQGVVITDREDRPLRRFLTEKGLRVDPPAVYADLPESLIRATLAAEDERFFHHRGIDWIGTGRAIRDAMRNRRFVSGASTVTQQLVKISSPRRSRNGKTKFLEIMRARKIEMRLGKEDILAAYLNRLPYGNQLTGCVAAARRYFGKPVSDLSLAEAALLAGLPNQPGRLNPYRNFELAKRRQQWVLDRMLREGLVSPEEHAGASREALLFQPAHSDVFHAPHFIELVERFHPEETAAARETGIAIRTSLDLRLQDTVETLVTTNLGRLAREHFIGERSDLQAAVVVIENATGEIRALTGSRSFFGSETGQINGAWTPRSAGSTLKPFTYVLALERGYTAGTVIPNVPVEYVSAAGAYQPVNFDRRFNGPVTLRDALATSLNVPAVRVLHDIGGTRLLHGFLSDDLGLTSLGKDRDIHGLGLTLGNAETRLLELTNAYACLARLGTWKPVRFFPAEEEGTGSGKRLFSGECGWLLADILSDNEARAPAFGIQSALHLPFRVAAKTGTSTDFRDNWTLGFTPDYTVGVWLGRFSNDPLPDRLSGALGAAPIFRDIILTLHEGREPSWYPKPEGIDVAEIDELNGLALSPSLEIRPKRVRKEFFRKSRIPQPAEEGHYTPEGRTLLPVPYAAWWNEGGHSLAAAAQVVDAGDGDSPSPVELRITSPLPGTVAYLDPDLPSGGQRFPLRIEGTGRETVTWSSPSLEIESRSGSHWAILKPGTHRVEAVDVASGARGVTTIQVEEL